MKTAEEIIAPHVMFGEVAYTDTLAAMHEYAAQDKWIRIEDGLPEVGEYYLILLDGETWLKGKLCYDGWMAFWQDGYKPVNPEFNTVTHYQAITLPNNKAAQQPTLPGEYYIAVPVSERLPEKKGVYFVGGCYDSGRHYFDGKYFMKGEDVAVTNNGFWLEETEIPSTREAASRAWDAAIEYKMATYYGDGKELPPNKFQWLNEHYPE